MRLYHNLPADAGEKIYYNRFHESDSGQNHVRKEYVRASGINCYRSF